MAPTVDDRWLWIGLGIFTVAAIKGVAHGLRHIVQLTTVHNPQPAPVIPSSNGKEDAIKLKSLQTLATCHNVEIRKAATKLLCERFIANRSARALLLKDMRTGDEDVRHRAQLAFNLLCDNNVLDDALGPLLSAPRPREGLSRRQAWEGSWQTTTLRNLGDRDASERDLRRRRREAMVLNEGDRPVSHEDVFMRNREGRLGTDEEQVPDDPLQMGLGERQA